MLTKKFLFAVFIILVIFCGYALAEAPLILSLPDTKILEKTIRSELVLKIGSDKANEDFYNFRSFTVDKNGQGPGELSNDATKINILSDGNIYVIDNKQRRINVYNPEREFLFSGKTSAYYNDIELLNNTYYLSGILLEEKYKLIHISRKLGRIDGEFGILVEPSVGVVQQINQLRFPQPWRVGLSMSNFTNIIATNKNEIMFSQDYPYRLLLRRILCRPPSWLVS